jgi:hypothetical protein
VGTYFKQEGFDVSDQVIRLMLSKLDFNPNFVPALPAYLEEQSKVLVQQNQIATVPDWSKLLNRELLQQAMKA